MVQLSHPYMTIRKTIVLTTQTFVSQVKPLFFNMLSRLVIAFLPRSKHLLISWLQSKSTLILCVKLLQLCLTLCDPMDCSPPSFSVHGILQAIILQWVAIPFSRGSSWPRARTRMFFTVWATREANNFRTEENKICCSFHFFHFAMNWWEQMPWS